MAEETASPRRGTTRTKDSSSGGGKPAAPPKRTRKTRVQAAPLPETEPTCEDTEKIALPPHEENSLNVAAGHAAEAGHPGEAALPPVDTESSAPVPESRAVRAIREMPAPPPSFKRLNLQTIELIVSPFRSFREIGHFQQTMSTLPGVQAVQPRHLQAGILQLRVECRNSNEMLRALSAEYPAPFSLVSQELHQVEIVFDDNSYPPAQQADYPAGTGPASLVERRGA